MAKKKVSPNWVMLLLVVIALVGVALGFFNPGLKYYAYIKNNDYKPLLFYICVI